MCGDMTVFPLLLIASFAQMSETMFFQEALFHLFLKIILIFSAQEIQMQLKAASQSLNLLNQTLRYL